MLTRDDSGCLALSHTSVCSFLLALTEKQTRMGTHQRQSFHQALAFQKLLWEEPDQGLLQTG